MGIMQANNSDHDFNLAAKLEKQLLIASRTVFFVRLDIDVAECYS